MNETLNPPMPQRAMGSRCEPSYPLVASAIGDMLGTYLISVFMDRETIQNGGQVSMSTDDKVGPTLGLASLLSIDSSSVSLKRLEDKQNNHLPLRCLDLNENGKNCPNKRAGL